MPRGDGTGPAGLGPMTGRNAGFCAGYPVPGFMNGAGGRGFYGRGRGGGRGYRNRFYATGLPAWARAGYDYTANRWPITSAVTPEQELAGLMQQAEHFQSALDGVKQRMAELEGADKK